MRGLKLDLEILLELLRQDYGRIIHFFEKNEYFLDHYLMNWLVCLFMSMSLSFRRKFEIMQYVIGEKKRGVFRIILFVLSENEEELLKCRGMAEIEEKLRDFYTVLEDKLLFAKLKRFAIDEKVIRGKIQRYNHDFDPDQYLLMSLEENPRDWVIQNYFLLSNETRNTKPLSAKSDNPVLVVKMPIEMSTETIHNRYKNYLFPI